jgi:Glycosyltransferase family 87
MIEWLRQRRGWITLIVLAAIYYPKFGKGFQSIALYTAGGRCILDGVALLPCQPRFSYQPALAALLLPFAVLPAALQKLVWYVICVGSLALTVRLAEAMAERLYPGATCGRNLIWLRTVSLFLCSKHILDVLNYQAYEAPALAMVTVGIWALTVGREALGGFWLAAAAAIRATPLIYLPYLLLKRRYLACAAFVAAFLAISFLPDVISALHGGHTGYFQDWVRQIAGPAMAPGTSSNLAFWDTWNGQNLNNQSLRGLVNRLAAGPIFGLSPTMILIAVDGVFGLVVAALLLISPRDKEYAAIDGAVLLVANLALSPMTSRYHFVLVLPAVVLVVAAVINDRRMRVFGSVVLAASFMLLTGTSNDLTAWLFGDFPYVYGFMTEGAIVLLAALAMMAGVWRPPGISAGEGNSSEQPPERQSIQSEAIAL